MEKTSFAILLWVYLVFGAAILAATYFLPTIVAKRRGKDRLMRLLTLNILLGWFPPSWGLLLFLAVKDTSRKQLHT